MLVRGKAKLLALALFGFGFPLSVWSQTVYIDDMLRVGIRSKPYSNEAPIKVVTTGEKLEVLEREGGYLRVRTDEGTEGWINGTYATEEIPARERVKMLVEERDRLAAALDDLQKTTAATVEENERLQREVVRLEHKATNPPAAPTSRDTEIDVKVSAQSQKWLVQAGLMVALLLAGFVFGARWYRHRVSDRFNGLEL